MRVITVNVCGIRSAASKGLFRWLRRQKADFICLQETKSQEHQLDEHDVRMPGYHSYFSDAERPGYAGVALYTRHQADRVLRGFGVDEFDREGRYLEVQVGKQYVQPLAAARQVEAQFADTAPRVENQLTAVIPGDLDARGVAAERRGPRARRRN